MKIKIKQLLNRLTILAFVILLFSNILIYKNYLNTRQSWILSIHSQFKNIYTLLSAIGLSTTSDADLSYIMPSLNKECIKLDSTIQVISLMNDDMIISKSSEQMYEKVFQYIEENNINGVNRCQEILEKAISKLSQKDNNLYDPFLKPNYQISTKEAINIINDALEEILSPYS